MEKEVNIRIRHDANDIRIQMVQPLVEWEAWRLVTHILNLD